MCVCSLAVAAPLFWEGDGGQLTFQGSYLNRRLRLTKLASCGPPAPCAAAVDIVSRQGSHTPEPQRHAFFTWAPFHLALVSSSFLVHIPLPVLKVEQIFETFFISFFSKMCDL